MINMNEILTQDTRDIDICDCDYLGHYRLQYLFNNLAQIATNDAGKRMMWNDEMNGHYGWVVTKQTLRLNKPIKIHDTITLLTTISTGSHVAFPRYYWILKDKEIIGECSSLWTLIDLDKRRIVAPKRIGLILPEVKCTQALEAPHTIHTPNDMQYICQRQVLYSDVDVNQHMNNTRYIEWAFDLIPYDYYKEHTIKELSINYKKEIAPLTHVDLYLCKEDLTYYIEGRKDDEVFFVVEIIFKNQ